ncbi:deleted in lung and esophageal cancer protein 1-like isoform X1 [Mizuhopecten yessoensis]|uniref:deleted in lung and esophageal cancer protein 1-like isoform X1 n=1 Tax=Mizuhopecten yessoensis TaxID=6573 RepID=UPI000B45F6FF|nr:deleted in lung and esophageal cancer protein 1-like isoform X1 [Mizuhopecten yessoensis]
MKTQPVQRGEEPPMFLQRPSTGKSQDVRHILAKTFRELYTRDAIGADTVANLGVSKHGDDPYHERYVEALQKVFEERQRRLEEASKLERHIMQAQARAMSADERQLNRVTKSCDNYSELGLPPGRSYFRSCIDSDLLKKHKLLSPEDYATEEQLTVPLPHGPKVPSYARETVSSQQRTRPFDQEEETPQPLIFNSRTDLVHQSYVSDSINVEQEILESEAASSITESDLFPKRGGWKIHMSEAQREVDRKDLANLQARVNYMRNPRFVPPSAPPGGKSLVMPSRPKPKEFGIQSKPDTGRPKEPSVVFLVSPPIVKFSDYKVGQVYELTLELKNVSAVMRQCTILPTTTQFFSVGLGQFPGEHGLVAPGMSCHYAIRFAPDALRDFDDEIKVQTLSSNSISVPLQGRRQPPRLTLPPVLDVGYCLVGGCHVVQFIVKNVGGNGRFCILPRSLWPATNFKSVVRNGSVHIQPFEIRPSVLELMKGESGVIEIIFTPPSVKSYSQDVTLVCDNCHVKHFTIKGVAQRAGVDLTLVERGEGNIAPGEMTDNTAEHMIRFDDLNPFTYTDRTVVVKNCTNVQMPFQWMIYKPEMKEEVDLEGQKKVVRAQDVDSVFSVHPPTGNLPPAGDIEFRVTFAPPLVNEFHSVLHMILKQIPQYEEGDSAKLRNRDRRALREKSNLSDSGDEEDEEEEPTEIFPPSSGVRRLRDLTAMEIEVKGNSVPLNVVLHPYAVFVPGRSLMETTIKKRVTMANHSRSTITFQWQPYSEGYILEMEPPFGELDPGMAMDLELGITGAMPGKINHTLYCHVMNMTEPLHLHVEAEFKGPELMIEEPDVSFGLVCLGSQATKQITLTNLAQIITKWSIHDSPEFIDLDNGDDPSEFVFTPASGELSPLEQKTISIELIPTAVKTIKRVFTVQVVDGSECNIGATAEVQEPRVCLASCEVCMDDVYKGVPVLCQATIINQTLIPTSFSWGKIQGGHAEDCVVELDPQCGELAPREERSIDIRFIANREGEISDVRIPCEVAGMEQLLFLGLFCDAKGLSVTYKTSALGQLSSEYFEDVCLDFEEKVDLGSTPKVYLHIQNLSGITAPYSLHMEHFMAKPPTPPGNKDPNTSRSQQRRVMLSRTPNLADPLSKTQSKAQQDLCKAMLSLGLGASFVPTPASGVLQPFGEQIIELGAYSDMWGLYTDNLMCKIGDLEVSAIPVKMNVVGCPLSFQMTAAKPDQKPIVRFGTHVSGVAATSRTMRINNTSPLDIRLDWQLFNLEEDDTKLLDFIVGFGDAFPKRDENGKEVIPPWKNEKQTVVPEMPKRMPTEFIPNSPDTLPPLTREVTRVISTPTAPAAPVVEPVPIEPLMKFASVFVRSHEGVPCESPYNIKNKQMMIPARGNASVSVNFTPFPTGQVSEETDCTGYAMGFMSLDNNKACTENKVSRLQGYNMSNLRLDMTAHLKPALLNIEPTDEEGMRYRSAMSDLLLEGGRTKEESSKVCSAVLANHTETPLTFKLITKPPFVLVDLNPSTNRAGATSIQETEMQTLRPQHNLLVKVAFQTSTDLLDLGEETEENGESDEVTRNQKIEINDHLTVEFNNSAVQKVPLYATLSVPQIQLSKQELDFGTCLVGQQRELQLLISNVTASHSFWTVETESMLPGCSQDTFLITPSSGQLEAHITHISDSKTLLHVFFTAKHAEYYEAMFVFKGVLGETPQRLAIKGQGSYDGRFEAILNV